MIPKVISEKRPLKTIEECHYNGIKITVKKCSDGKRYYFVDDEYISRRNLERKLGLGYCCLSTRVNYGYPLDKCVLPASDKFWAEMRTSSAARKKEKEAKQIPDSDTVLCGVAKLSSNMLRVKL